MNWKPLMIALTVLAFVVFYAIPVFAAKVYTQKCDSEWGATRHGMGFVIATCQQPGPMIEFRIYFTTERL